MNMHVLGVDEGSEWKSGGGREGQKDRPAQGLGRRQGCVSACVEVWLAPDGRAGLKTDCTEPIMGGGARPRCLNG